MTTETDNPTGRPVQGALTELAIAGELGAPGALPRGEVLGRGAAVGRYLILARIGRGGMGEVYAAYDPELDRRVALKRLHAARSSEDARKRLVREARARQALAPQRRPGLRERALAYYQRVGHQAGIAVATRWSTEHR